MHSSASLSWFAMVVVGLVVLGGIACLSALLANRHTRGTTKSFLGFGGFVAVALVAAMFWVRSSSHQSHVARAQQQQLRAQLQTQSAILEQAHLMASEVQTSGLDPESAKAQLQQAAALVEEAERMIQAGDISPIDGHFRQMKANEAQHWQQIADGYAATPGVEELATQYQSRANQARADAEKFAEGVPTGFADSSSHTNTRVGFALLSPLALIIGAAVVFMAFKHGGNSVGLAVLGLPLLLIGFAFVSYNSARSTNSHRSPIQEARTQTVPTDVRFADNLFKDAPYNQPSTEATAKVRVETGEIVTGDFTASEPVETSQLATSGDNLATGEQSPEDGEAVADSSEEASKEVADPISPKLASSHSNNAPEWVRNPEKSVPHVYRRLIESDWRDSAETCQRHNALKIENAVHEYIQELANEHTYGAYVPSLAELGVTPRYIREQILKEHYYASRDFAHQSGMVNLYQQLEFDSRVSEDLAGRWRTFARQQHVAGVAVMSGSVLAVLAGVLGLIKLDTYTKGFYTKRLFIGVPAAIIGGILLALQIGG